MFNFGSTKINDTSLLGQSTPVNQYRIGTSFLFGNTTAISSFGKERTSFEISNKAFVIL